MFVFIYFNQYNKNEINCLKPRNLLVNINIKSFPIITPIPNYNRNLLVVFEVYMTILTNINCQLIFVNLNEEVSLAK